MTIEEMERIRKEKGLTYRQISERSGVALGTVQKIFGKTTTSPRYDTVKKLTDLFVQESSSYHTNRPATRGRIKISRIDRPGTYTIDDYYDWPDEERIELIDGVTYDMAAPSTIHQLLSTGILNQVFSKIMEKGCKCVPFAAPIDVRLDCDERTMVQPDFLIVCDRSKINEKRIEGAPDFIIEILSESTRMKDTFIKQNKYMSSGVREYWTVDLKHMTVTVYLFEESRVIQYGVEEKIPIGIYDGEIVVDFAGIMAYVKDVLGDDVNE